MSKRQTAESTCSSCYAPILWASQSTGGQIPLNIRAEQINGASQGPFFMLDELEMRCTRASMEVIEKGRKLWTNHLVTCQKRERSAA
jgi:hypothetical protein